MLVYNLLLNTFLFNSKRISEVFFFFWGGGDLRKNIDILISELSYEQYSNILS